MSAELYPIPENEAATKFIFGRARRARDEQGRMLLERVLDQHEREYVRERLQEIARHLKAAKRGEAQRELLAIFPDVEVDVAKARAKALAEAMDGLPMFAIKRAGLQISQRGIRAPDRVMLRTEAEAVVRPYWNEASIGSLLLHAKKNPATPTSAGERERIIAGFADLLDALRQGEEESPFGAKARRRRTKRLIRETRERRMQDFRDEGIEPVFADKGRNIVVSLPLLQRLGWRVETFRGETVLARADGTRVSDEERTE